MNIFGNRARLMPPTLPKTQFNPITRIHVKPVAIQVTSVTRQIAVKTTSPAISSQLSCKPYPLQGPSLRDAMYKPGILRMRLQSLPGLHPGYSDPSWGGDILAPKPNGFTRGVNGGVNGGDIGGLLPQPDITIPYEPSDVSEITEADVEDSEVVTPTQIPSGVITTNGVIGEPLISPSIWEQVIRTGPSIVPAIPFQVTDPSVMPITPEEAEGIITDKISVMPDEPGAVTYVYKDLIGKVTFSLHNAAKNPMRIDVLVSVMYKEWEIARTTVKAMMMPLKENRYVAEFSVIGDVTDVWESLSQETAPAITIDAVVSWQFFRNSISDTKNVPLTLPES